MHATATEQKKFNPITLELTFETQAELDNIKKFIRNVSADSLKEAVAIHSIPVSKQLDIQTIVNFINVVNTALKNT